MDEEQHPVDQLGHQWAEAEQRGDAETLDVMTTDDFTLVGPLGFVLDKQQWLDRYRSDDLVTRSLVWDQVQIRDYGDAAIAVGRQTQEAAHRGRPSDGAFRVTHVAVRDGERWRFAGIHLSPITPLPGPPTGPQHQ